MPAGESTRFRGDDRRTRRANQGLKTFQARPPTAGSRPPDAPRKSESLFRVVEVPAADHAAGGPRRRRPSLDALGLGVHRGLEDEAERVRVAPAAGRAESLFAVVEVPAADHAAGGPRGGRPGLHALGVHRGLEDVAERVPARRPPAAPRESESLFAVVEVPAADHAAGGPRGGRPGSCTEDSKTSVSYTHLTLPTIYSV